MVARRRRGIVEGDAMSRTPGWQLEFRIAWRSEPTPLVIGIFTTKILRRGENAVTGAANSDVLTGGSVAFAVTNWANGREAGPIW